MSESIIKKIKYGSRLYLILFCVLSAIQIIGLIFVNIYIKEKAYSSTENRYHKIDEVYASLYLSNEEVSKGSFSFGKQPETYISLIDQEGNIIAHSAVSEAVVTGTNIFKFLNLGKVYDMPTQDACDAIVSGEEGRFEFFNNNLNKVLIYTPVGDGHHFIVRVIPKKNFVVEQNDYLDVITVSTWFAVAIIILMFLIIIRFKKYTEGMEKSVARHDLIASDNNLISFTYHPSIACFEMMGAVDKIFGPEIGKRSQVDWNTFSSLLHPDDQMLLRNISKAIKDKQEKYTTEFRFISTDGDYHWYRMNAKCIPDSSGSVAKFVGTIQNSDDQITHENMLKNKAEHDLLTGLLNKITIEETVNSVVSKVGHNVYAFYIIDLDNFKAVNDNLGHAIGDKVLVDVASKLKLIFNESDFIGRLGGDEFAVLLVIPAMMISQAEKLIREKAIALNDILRAEYGDDSITINVSASIGISVYPEDGTDFQALYQHADKGLYYSKEHGKNQFTFYSEVK